MAQPRPMLTTGKVAYEVGANTDATLIGYHPSLDRLFSAWRTIERTRFG